MRMIQCLHGSLIKRFNVFKEWQMNESRGSTNKAVLVQTIILVITLLSIAVAADRRVTSVEGALAAEKAVREVVDKQYGEILKQLQHNQNLTIENQARVTALVDKIEKRHDNEDRRK
jgi:hypothetical protein